MIKKIRPYLAHKLPPGSFARNVIILMSGTTLGQVVSILVSPILTRLYSPAEFGIYAQYTSILAILSVIACWRYETPIVLPARDEEAANLLALALIISVFMALLTLGGVTLWGKDLEILLGAPGLGVWLWFMPLSVLATGFFMATNYWSTRRRHFGRLAIRSVTQSIVMATTQVGTGLLPRAGAGGLIGGHIAGQMGATVRLAWQIEQDEGQELRSYVNGAAIKDVAFEYRRYPFFSSWSGLLNTLANVIPNFMLGYFFSPIIVGLYALGQRVLFSPMELLGKAVERVYLPQAVQHNRDEKLQDFTRIIYRQLVDISLTPISMIALLAPVIFSVAFGSRWTDAGEYTRWLCAWAIFRFIISPLTGLFDVYGKQKQELIFNCILFALRFIALYVGGTSGNPLLTVALFGGVSAAMYLLLGLYLFSLCHLSRAEYFLPILRSLGRSLPYLLPVGTAYWLVKNQAVIIIIAVLAGSMFTWEKRKVFSELKRAGE